MFKPGGFLASSLDMSVHDDVIKWQHFRVSGHLWREFTGHQRIPRIKASDAELWCFFLFPNRQLSKQSQGGRFETPSCPLWRHCNVQSSQQGGCWWSDVYLTPRYLLSIPSACRRNENWFSPLSLHLFRVHLTTITRGVFDVLRGLKKLHNEGFMIICSYMIWK